eukprot:PITA_28292
MSRTASELCFLVIATTLLLPLLCIPTLCLGSEYQGCLWDTCGDFEFSYPFGKINSGCGDPQFQIHCDQNRYPLLNINGDEYLILQPSLFQNGMKNPSITVINYNLSKILCGRENIPSGNYSEFWWPVSHFHVAGAYSNLTLWKHCNESIHGESFQKLRVCGHDWYSISNPESGRRFCQSNIQLPVTNNLPVTQNGDLITQLPFGFEITWNVDTNRDRTCSACLDSQGGCGYDALKPTTFLCYCSDGTSHLDRCPANTTGRKTRSAIVIGCSFGIIVVATLAVLLLILCVKRRRPAPGSSIPKVENFLKEYASEMPMAARHSFSHFKKITDSSPEPK